MQGNVQQGLIVGAVEERRVDRDHGMGSPHCESGGTCHGMLLGDPDIEEAVRMHGTEVAEPGGPGHGSGDCDDLGTSVRLADERFCECLGPGTHGGSSRLPSARVDHADTMEAVGIVGLRRQVAATLLRQAVHDHRPGIPGGTLEGAFHQCDVVTVDGTDVLDAQVLEHPLGRDNVLDALLDTVQRLEHGATHDGGAIQGPTTPAKELLIAPGGA